MARLNAYCIDSDILIDYLRGIEKSRTFLVNSSNESRLYISVVSVVEIYAGKETENALKRQHISKFLQSFNILILEANIAAYAGQLRRDYQRPFADMIIAATAVHYQISLVTRNTKHFKDIKHLKVFQPY